MGSVIRVLIFNRTAQVQPMAARLESHDLISFFGPISDASAIGIAEADSLIDIDISPAFAEYWHCCQ